MKTVLITGAARGIGRECALLFAKSGYAVAINYNSSENQAKELERLIGPPSVAIKADVSDEAQVRAMFERARAHFGKGFDVIINNAGISLYGLFTDIPLSDFKRLLDVNVCGPVLCCKYGLPYMIERKSGCIINISSVWGICGASCEVHYSVSKAAIIGLTKALAKEVGPSNVTVNCIAPGVIDTDMLSCFSKEEINALKEQTPLGRIGKPEDVAHLALYLASDSARFITGQVISPNGGFVI
jgi:3-oxoacyl-[acyl-carrier protein] reductase